MPAFVLGLWSERVDYLGASLYVLYAELQHSGGCRLPRRVRADFLFFLEIAYHEVSLLPAVPLSSHPNMLFLKCYGVGSSRSLLEVSNARVNQSEGPVDSPKSIPGHLRLPVTSTASVRTPSECSPWFSAVLCSRQVARKQSSGWMNEPLLRSHDAVHL